MKTATICACVVAMGCTQSPPVAVTANAVPFDLKGDRLGMSLDDFKQRHGDELLIEENAKTRIASALLSETIAGFRTDGIGYLFVDGQLCKIFCSFDQSDFGVVAQAMKDKYGKPTSATSETYQNAFGAKFSGTIAEWDNGISTIWLSERGETLTQSNMTMRHTLLARVADERTKAAAPRAKDDL